MGQSQSCVRYTPEFNFFRAVQFADLETVELSLSIDPAILNRTTFYDRCSAFHIAASNGHFELLSMLLGRSVNPDLLNRHKQTPLMLAAMHGKIECVQKLLEAGANILKFDSVQGRTCLHFAAYHGNPDCLQAILSAAQSTTVVNSWGFARFVNVSDGTGATPLHLAARQGHRSCVRILLDNGALVSALTARYGCPGSSPLHLAARGGSLDCVRELLSWGADRLQKDASGRIPYFVALKRKHGACAALLNPGSAEPLVWPSPLKFISELNPDAKALLEEALVEANRAREKNILRGTAYSFASPIHREAEINDDYEDHDDYTSEINEYELCCICFDQACTIEVQDCGHQMCAHCTLALCCHNRPNPATSSQTPPVCPFCRSNIIRLVAAKSFLSPSKARRSRNLTEGSSSFKGLPSTMATIGKMGSRIADSSDMLDKP
ncbi:E3 ubiquitin-protein ligase XB3-like [Phalaenopsis equestris]|uniref:E3 ubiquitin-protein ligase XB3-like n=1 Tax=Phalaenopsis equestris TaxID=78828 RepID=UPI0009E3385A|nr:E3 ubiquitin-protein ligase XB3-like [Phalaenopsis equestris]